MPPNPFDYRPVTWVLATGSSMICWSTGPSKPASPAAAGERFIAAGDFLWMSDIARTMRTELGERGRKVPTRGLPTFLVKALLPFLPNLRTLAPLIGRKFPLTPENAQRVPGFNPRPASPTVIDCAEGLLQKVTA